MFGRVPATWLCARNEQVPDAWIFPPVHLWQTSSNRLQYGRVLAIESTFHKS